MQSHFDLAARGFFRLFDEHPHDDDTLTDPGDVKGASDATASLEADFPKRPFDMAHQGKVNALQPVFLDQCGDPLKVRAMIGSECGIFFGRRFGQFNSPGHYSKNVMGETSVFCMATLQRNKSNPVVFVRLSNLINKLKRNRAACLDRKAFGRALCDSPNQNERGGRPHAPETIRTPIPRLRPRAARALAASRADLRAGRANLPGVLRIALVGSLTTPKPLPKDADVLVTIEDGLDLAPLAAKGRA